MKDPEHARNHGEIEKWLETHSTRDGHRRANKAFERLRTDHSMRRKFRASGQNPDVYRRYRHDGPN